MRFAVILISLVISACATHHNAITAGGSQLEIRQIQTRTYDTLDRRATLRSVVATLQDLGFVIDKADYELATISATKLQNYEIRMTVTVREKGGNRLAVRANARFNNRPIEDPASYQDFFAALSKAMFLTAQQID